MTKEIKKKDKVEELLKLDQITTDDLNKLSKTQFKRFYEEINDRLPELEGEERDEFLAKLEPITDESTKNALWENNHSKIINAIYDLMCSRYRIPSKTEISNQSGLSRQTVHKHLKEFQNHPLYKGQIEAMNIMTSKVVATVCEQAITGDMRAAKLFLNIIGTRQGTINQNNYIQINNTILSQDKLELLNKDQLSEIENIIRSVELTKKQTLEELAIPLSST